MSLIVQSKLAAVLAAVCVYTLSSDRPAACHALKMRQVKRQASFTSEAIDVIDPGSKHTLC